MASFPGAVKSFTSKNSGDVIQGSHVNDLQDEVAAIEDSYVNGTGRLNSSNSTLATLSVSGASTFAARPFTPPPQMAVVYQESSLAVSSVASTQTWTAQLILTNSSMHSTTTNPERLIPQSTGVYHAQAQYALGGVTDTDVLAQITIEDSSQTPVAISRLMATTVVSGYTFLASGYKRFDAVGGYLTARFTRGASTMSLSSGIGQTWFSLVKL